MFTKRISPFACIVICLLVCAVSCVAVASIMSTETKKSVNDERLEGSKYNEYGSLIDAIADNDERYLKLTQMFSMIEAYYVHDYENDAVWEEMYRALARSLADDYSQYFTAAEYESLLDSSDGNFVGIGVHASYDVDTEGVYIFGVMPDSPAEKAGMKKGDIIIAAEGIESSDATYYDLLDAIPGEAGTDVTVTLKRGEEELTLTMTRAAVASENVIYEKLGNGVAHIRILSFADTGVSEEFSKKLAQAQADGCDKFIYDVRNNTGGSLDEICAILDVLLPKGPIINIVDKNGTVQTIESDESFLDAKSVVLCNDLTASAAELFTAALRDYELAETVGVTTFGKGTMQTTRLLPDGSALKLSTAFYNPPSNVSYDKIGITPDHEIALPEHWVNRFFKMTLEDDVQLQKALELLVPTE